MKLQKSYKILSSFDLKNIALITMITDHIGFCFYPGAWWLRIVGRIAFVLYAFLLVEGFKNTSNLKAYKKKLFIWGLISEIPYDLVFYNSWFSVSGQNIFFTLLIGLIGLEFTEKTTNWILKALILFSTILVAYRLNFDYSAYGVSLIYLFYYFRNIKVLKFSTASIIGVMYGFSHFILQCFSFLGLIPIFLYNGKRGRKTGTIYYSLYAGHLLLFYLTKEYLRHL